MCAQRTTLHVVLAWPGSVTRMLSAGQKLLVGCAAFIVAGCSGGSGTTEAPPETANSPSVEADDPAPSATTTPPPPPPEPEPEIDLAALCSSLFELEGAGRYNINQFGIAATDTSAGGVASILEDLARESGAPDDHPMVVLAESLRTSPALSLTADVALVARAAANVDAPSERALLGFNAEVDSECGGPLFGDGFAALFEDLSPTLVPGGGIEISRSNLYGASTSRCSDVIATTTGHLLWDCDDFGIVGVNLEDAQPWRITQSENEQVQSVKANANVVAVVVRSDTPASGLEPASTQFLARGYQVGGDEVLWEVDLGYDPDDEYADIIEDFEIRAVTSTGVALLDSPIFYACGRRIPDGARAISPDGQELWTSDHLLGALGPLAIAANGNDRGDCGDDTPYTESLRVGSSGNTVFNGSVRGLNPDDCSPWLFFDDTAFNLMTGETATGTGRLIGTADALVEVRDDGIYPLSSPGNATWSLPSGLSIFNYAGELAVRDDSGDIIIVDTATGEEARRFPGRELADEIHALGVVTEFELDSPPRRQFVLNDDSQRCALFDEFAVGASVAALPAPTTTTTTTAPPTNEERITAFYSALITEAQGGNTDYLIDRLHPAHFEIYTSEECREAVATIDWTGLSITGAVASEIESIDLGESRIVEFGNAYRVQVSSSEGEFELTASDDAGGPFWFANCG